MKTTGYILLATAVLISLIFYGVVFYQLGTSPTDITRIDVSLSEGLNLDLNGPDPYSFRMVQTSVFPLITSLTLVLIGLLFILIGSCRQIGRVGET
jgi:hypothetical protein